MTRIFCIAEREGTAPDLVGRFMDDRGVRCNESAGPTAGGAGLDAHGYDAVIVLGADDGMRDAFVHSIRAAVEGNVPVLGVLRGAGLLAEACFSPAAAGDRRNDWSPILLTGEGKKDILLYGVPGTVNAFLEHDRGLELPPGGIPLAVGTDGALRAFRYRNAYVVDFFTDVREHEALMSGGSLPVPENVAAAEAACREMIGYSRMIFDNLLWLTELCRRLGETRRGSVSETGPP